MADQSDVENVLVTLVAAALYPAGAGGPSVPGPDCRIYRGWPKSAALDADLSAGRVNVTIFPQGEAGHNTTRYMPEWTGTLPEPTMTVQVTGNSVSFAGTADPALLVGILADGKTYVYQTLAGDTLALIAANLAGLLRSDMVVQLAGAAFTVPGVSVLVARVVSSASMQQEVRRQQQGFRISCWCPSPAVRDSVAATIDSVLAALCFTSMPDGSQARVRYAGTLVFDQSEDALLYRRDLLYDVEYSTTVNATQPTMLFGDLLLNAATFTA